MTFPKAMFSSARDRLQRGQYRALLHVVGIQLGVSRRLSQLSRRPVSEEGSVSTETVAWFAISLAIVTLVGGIITGKLQALAQSLPDTLNW